MNEPRNTSDRDRDDEREAAVEQTEDVRAETDADRVDEGDEDLHLARSVVSVIQPAWPAPSDRGAGAAREEAHDPVPDAAAVDEDEQGREEHEQHAGEDVADAAGPTSTPALSNASVFSRRLLTKFVDGLVDLGLGQLQRRLEQPLLEVRPSARRVTSTRSR